MPQKKKTLDQFSVYIPVGRVKERIIPRLIEIGKARKRSVNWICIEAIDEYLERQEAA